MIILPRTNTTDRDVGRGRDVTKRINDAVDEYRARGETVVEVRVSRHAADYMVAYFCSWSRDFDGVLPLTVKGVPFVVGDTGTDDLQIRLAADRRN